MTVRFLTSWNGYSAGDRATLGSTLEASLISGGLARAYYVQDAPVIAYPPNADYAAAVVGAAGAVGQDVLLIGDSITQENFGPGTVNTERWSNYSWLSHLNAMLGGSLNVVANLGVSGQTTATLRTRIPEILTYDAGVVFWIMSGNGIANGVVTATLLDDTEYILDQLTNAGKKVFVGLVPPRALSGTGSFSTTAMLEQVQQVNRFAVSYARGNQRVFVADTFSPLVNLATGAPRTGVCRDSPAIHPGPWGAQRLAGGFYAACNGKFGNAAPLSFVGAPYNLIATNLASWTGSDVGGTVTTTDSTTATGSDGLADWLQIDATAFSAIGAVRQYAHPLINTGYSVGDILQGAVEVEVDSATDIRAFNFQIRLTGSGLNLETMSEFSAAQGFTVYASGPLKRLVYVTPEFAVPTGTTSITPVLRTVAQTTSAAAKVRYRRPTIINKTLAGY